MKQHLPSMCKPWVPPPVTHTPTPHQSISKWTKLLCTLRNALLFSFLTLHVSVLPDIWPRTYGLFNISAVHITVEITREFKGIVLKTLLQTAIKIWLTILMPVENVTGFVDLGFSNCISSWVDLSLCWAKSRATGRSELSCKKSSVWNLKRKD